MDAVLAAALRYLRYDPNFAADDDEGGDEDMGNDEDADEDADG
jgi:cullin-associated NEDD8-dissociated protein 1